MPPVTATVTGPLRADARDAGRGDGAVGEGVGHLTGVERLLDARAPAWPRRRADSATRVAAPVTFDVTMTSSPGVSGERLLRTSGGRSTSAIFIAEFFRTRVWPAGCWAWPPSVIDECGGGRGGGAQDERGGGDADAVAHGGECARRGRRVIARAGDLRPSAARRMSAPGRSAGRPILTRDRPALAWADEDDGDAPRPAAPRRRARRGAAARRRARGRARAGQRAALGRRARRARLHGAARVAPARAARGARDRARRPCWSTARSRSEGSHQTLILALALASFTAGYELPLPPRVGGAGDDRRRRRASPCSRSARTAATSSSCSSSTSGRGRFGQALRTRGHRVDELSARAERLELERQQAEAAAVEAERARIARELHDVVSHSISVITVQAQAIRRRLGPEHEREAADLAGRRDHGAPGDGRDAAPAGDAAQRRRAPAAGAAPRAWTSSRGSSSRCAPRGSRSTCRSAASRCRCRRASISRPTGSCRRR